MRFLQNAQSIVLIILAAACGDTIGLGGPPDGGQAGTGNTTTSGTGTNTTGSAGSTMSTTTNPTTVGAGGSGGATGSGGSSGAGGAGGRPLCPSSMEGSACSPDGQSPNCSLCTPDVACCRHFLACLSGKWQQLEAGPCQTPDAGQVCGGFTGTQCPSGYFCDYAPTDLCGAADATGICHGGAPTPCLADCPGVCGCDGKFYCNACVAHNSGTDDSTDRSCLKLDAGADATGKVCGGFTGTQCPSGYFCDFASAAEACGIADAQGTCKPRPQGCTADCPGTCGCDGKMYCNACSAQMVGVDESFDKSCLKKDGG